MQASRRNKPEPKRLMQYGPIRTLRHQSLRLKISPIEPARPVHVVNFGFVALMTVRSSENLSHYSTVRTHNLNDVEPERPMADEKNC